MEEKIVKNKLDFLYQFRRCTQADTLEKVIENTESKYSGAELLNFLSAADHRLAEIKMGKFYEKVPSEVWKYVI